MEEKDKVSMDGFVKFLRGTLFMDGMNGILKLITELKERIAAVSTLTDCTRERFSEILVDIPRCLFKAYTTYDLAVKYGLIVLKEEPVEFYFERMCKRC